MNNFAAPRRGGIALYKFWENMMEHFFKNVQGFKSRAMFGGQGLYKNGVIFGIIAEGDVYFKVDDTNLSHYEKAGSHPFTYTGAKGRPIAMSYWKVPDKVLKNEKTLNTWIEWSLKISLKKSAKALSRTKS